MPFRRKGPKLSTLLKREKTRVRRLKRTSYRLLKDAWTKIVLGTRWESNRSSPKSLIIARTKAGVLEYGWRNYPGSKRAARQRFKERDEIFKGETRRILSNMGRG